MSLGLAIAALASLRGGFKRWFSPTEKFDQVIFDNEEARHAHTQFIIFLHHAGQYEMAEYFSLWKESLDDRLVSQTALAFKKSHDEYMRGARL